MRVGLTGGTGHLGTVLLPLLLADPAVEVVQSVARRPLRTQDRRVRHLRSDLRTDEARRALEGVDVCFHLGFQLWPGSSRSAMAAANRDGTANVLAARPAGVVFASSAAVYGAWPDNPLPIDETHRPRPNPEVAYAAHKLEAERRCLDAAPTVVVRLAAVLGAHADPAVARGVAGYRLAVPAMRGVGQALQFLDEADAARALLAGGRSLGAGGPGGGHPGGGRSAVCNAGTADWLTATDIAAVAGGRVLTLPRRALLGFSEVGRKAKLLPFGADRAALINGPLALDPSRAATDLGWAPTRTSAEVLAAALGRSGGPLVQAPHP